MPPFIHYFFRHFCICLAACVFYSILAFVAYSLFGGGGVLCMSIFLAIVCLLAALEAACDPE